MRDDKPYRPGQLVFKRDTRDYMPIKKYSGKALPANASQIVRKSEAKAVSIVDGIVSRMMDRRKDERRG